LRLSELSVNSLGLWHRLGICCFATLLVAGLSGCRIFHRHRGADLEAMAVNPGDQPDKILFEKAMKEINRGRYDVGRLTLQTLINTYPDSEYLAKAKLAIADSYYNEGGTSGLTQAEAEYKDFITFFPTAPEAPEAQYRAGMAHFRLMAKADRDRTEAKLAEIEFKEFLTKYPDSPLMPRVKARLRETQEVLGQGDFKIAKFYYLKGANLAARSRFEEIVDRYPDFSQVDSSLWYLGQSLERLRRPKEATPYYSRIVSEHPYSPVADDAKERLTALHAPIPRPTRAVLARARADALPRPRRGLIDKLAGGMSGSPDTSATRHGPVHVGPPRPSEVEMAKGVTAPAAAPGNTIVAQPVSALSLDAGTAQDPKPADKAAGDGKTDAVKSADSPPPPPPRARKKSKFRFIKKIVPY